MNFKGDINQIRVALELKGLTPNDDEWIDEISQWCICNAGLEWTTKNIDSVLASEKELFSCAYNEEYKAAVADLDEILITELELLLGDLPELRDKEFISNWEPCNEDYEKYSSVITYLLTAPGPIKDASDKVNAMLAEIRSTLSKT